MKRQLTESQAWREIARKIAENEWDHEGLCAEVSTLQYGATRLDPFTAGRMRNRIHEHLIAMPKEIVYGERYTPSWFDKVGAGASRVLAALFLAEEAKDDEAAARGVAASGRTA